MCSSHVVSNNLVSKALVWFLHNSERDKKNANEISLL